MIKDVFGFINFKGISDWKACLDCCEASSSKKLWKFDIFFPLPKQKRSTDWEASVVFWEVAWFFSQTNGRKNIQMFTTSSRVFAIIHPRFLKSLWLYLCKIVIEFIQVVIVAILAWSDRFTLFSCFFGLSLNGHIFQIVSCAENKGENLYESSCKLLYDRNPYSGLGPILKPKLLADTVTDTETTFQRENLVTNIEIIWL